MWLQTVILVCLVSLICVSNNINAQDTSNNGYRLARESSYFIVCGRHVRPNEVYQLSSSVMALYQESLEVRATIKRYETEIASTTRSYTTTGTALMQMWIPDNATPGNYTLMVSAIAGGTEGGVGGYVFYNETRLIFQPKQVSVFIQFNKPFYMQGQTVFFRIMPVEVNLMSRSGSMDVYIEDSTNTVVRRWLSMQTNAGGVLDMSFNISRQPDYGDWKIKVKAWGYWYNKPFRVDEFYQPMIDVNVSTPLYIWENDFGLAGTIMANLSLGQPIRGTSQVRLEIRPPGKTILPNNTQIWPNITRDSTYCEGVTDFLFTMTEIQAAAGGSVADKELYVEAEVYDWYRQVHQKGWSITVVYNTQVNVDLLGDSSRTFKPGQLMYIYYAVSHQDGSPLHRTRRMLTITGTESTSSGTKSIDAKILVRDDGVAVFPYMTHDNGEFIRINAFYDLSVDRSVEMTATRHYSPTESFLIISSSTTKPMVDQYMIFTIKTSTFVNKIYYLMVTAGNIITGGSLEMSSRQKTFSLALSRDMMPEAHMLAWYVHDDEVIADSLNFFVNGTDINPVNMTVNRGKDFTGDTMEVNAYSDPSSYMGFAGIQYNLWRHGYNPFITETDIITEMETYDEMANTSFTHMWKLAEEQTQLIHFPAPSYGIDANTTFEYAGLIVFTDANVTRIPHFCNDSRGWWPCMDGSCYHMDQWCDGTRQCVGGQDEMGCPQIIVDPFTPPQHRLNLVTRHYFEQGEWVWGGHFIMPYGRLDFLTHVPEEALSFVIGAFGISRNLGFGITYNPIRHEATRPFYIRIEAPTRAIKGEQIGVRVALFNYWNQNLEVLVMLHGSPNYKFVAVEEYGIVSSYNPRTITGDVQTMIYLVKGSTYEIQMPVIPIKNGPHCVEVIISAIAFIYSDTDAVTICTEYDGVQNYYHTPFFIDLINSGSMVLPDLYVPVPERFVKPGERQHLYVPGSPHCDIGIVGDVVGPGLYSHNLTTEQTLHKPYGSAEASMFNFAYRAWNLRYMKATNQLRNEIIDQGLMEMNMDLQRIMSYINDDGSFSMFRDYQTHTPSTWVTAFILKTLSVANERDWELRFFVPSDLMNRIGLWLCKQRNPVSGAFVENSPIYDRKMWSHNTTVVDGVELPSNYSLTAYVIISLHMATQITGDADSCKNEAIKAAQGYLENALPTLTDVYTLSIVTYALHRVGSSERTKAFYMLSDLQRTNPYVYWAQKPIPANNVTWVNNLPYHQPRDWYDNEGYAVESTSYALLTYLIQNRMTDSVPIMKWLQSVRNTYAGMASTQDSIAALEALVEFAKLDTNRALYNIEVEVQATSMGNTTAIVPLNRTNWVDQQIVNIDPVWGSVRGRVQGTGMALLQMATYSKVEYPWLQRPQPLIKYFDVEITQWNFTGRNFSIMEMTPCARWAATKLSPRSGLAVVEMHIPTGYIVTNDVLRAYAQSGEVPTLRRAERYGRKVVFYFDYLTTNKTCVKVRMDRWYPIANMTIEHKLRVFDYFEPGMHNTTMYNTWQLFNLHLCRVCGSFQCPYCRFYNEAPPVVSTRTVCPLAAALVLWAVTWLTRS